MNSNTDLIWTRVTPEIPFKDIANGSLFKTLAHCLFRKIRPVKHVGEHDCGIEWNAIDMTDDGFTNVSPERLVTPVDSIKIEVME